MTDALVRTNELGLMELGDVLVKSGFFKDATHHAQAITKVLLGRELGLAPMASMLGIHVIDGKPSIGAHVIASGIKRSGRYDYRVLSKTATECRIEFLHRDPGGPWESLGVEEHTLEDARKAGLASRPPWAKHPKAMLFARTIGNGYRTFCPDALGLLAYAEGELDESQPIRGAVEAEHHPAPEDGRPARRVRVLPPETAPAPVAATVAAIVKEVVPDPLPASPAPVPAGPPEATPAPSTPTPATPTGNGATPRRRARRD